MIFRNYKRQITTIISNRYIDTKVISDNQIYSIALEVIRNEHLVDAFLLSEFGGYTRGQLNRIKNKR